MATVIPNRAGEAIQRSSENLINLILQRQRLDLDRQQLAQQAEQFERNMQFAESGRTHGLVRDRLMSLPPGMTIGEAGFTPQMLQQAGLGDLDPNYVMTPETLPDVLNKLGLDSIRAGGPRQDLVELWTNRVITGEAKTDDAIALQSIVDEANFTAVAQKLLNATPEQRDILATSYLGLPQPVTITIGDQVIEYDSATQMQGTLGHLQLMLSERLAGQTGSDINLQYREALKARMEEVGVTKFGLGNANARALSERILAGEFNSPEAIAAIPNPGARAFVQTQLSEREGATENYLDMYMNSPEGQSMAIMALQAEQFSKLPGADPSIALQMMNTINEQIARATGVPYIYFQQKKWWQLGTPDITPTLRSPPQGPRPAAGDTTAGPGNIGPPVVTNPAPTTTFQGQTVPIPSGNFQGPSYIDLTTPRDTTIPVPEDLLQYPDAVDFIQRGGDPEFFRMLLQPVPER